MSVIEELYVEFIFGELIMTNEQLGKEKAIVRAHPDYAQAVELIEQIKRLKLEIGRKEFQLAALDIYGSQASFDDMEARLNILIEREVA